MISVEKVSNENNCNVLKKPISTEDEDLEETREYIYLGKVLTFKDKMN